MARSSFFEDDDFRYGLRCFDDELDNEKGAERRDLAVRILRPSTFHWATCARASPMRFSYLLFFLRKAPLARENLTAHVFSFQTFPSLVQLNDIFEAKRDFLTTFSPFALQVQFSSLQSLFSPLVLFSPSFFPIHSC
jgi:hypothetical protein